MKENASRKSDKRRKQKRKDWQRRRGPEKLLRKQLDFKLKSRKVKAHKTDRRWQRSFYLDWIVLMEIKNTNTTISNL